MNRAPDPGRGWEIGRGRGPICLPPDSLFEIGEMGEVEEKTGFSIAARGVAVVKVI